MVFHEYSRMAVVKAVVVTIAVSAIVEAAAAAARGTADERTTITDIIVVAVA